MQGDKVEGLIIKKYSSFYYVRDSQDKLYECKLRGKVKDLVLTGDKVIITNLDNEKGVIEEILPRQNELYRPRIANVTKVFIVMAHDRPAPSLILLDKLLFLAYYNSIEPMVIINKADLGEDENAKFIKEYYPSVGIKVIPTSTKTKQGIEELKAFLKDEIVVLAGPSGAGKSSLLNLLLDGVNIKTQAVSDKIGRGKHTTRHVELFITPNNGLIADTPGFSIIDMPDINKVDLVKFFPDLYAHHEGCKFNDCLHWKEKECSIKDAVVTGDIAEVRYNNYLTMLAEVIEKERVY